MDTHDEAEETPSYTLSLEGEGITLERKVTKDVALAVINVALGGAPGIGGSSGGAGPGASAGSRVGSADAGNLDDRTTPGEFIESVNARTNPEKIVAFGVFLNRTRGQGDFSRDDIRAMFRAAHEPAPANFGRDFRNALASNWIAEEGSSERYFVTNAGRKAVDDQFATARKRKPRRRSARTASASSGAEEI